MKHPKHIQIWAQMQKAQEQGDMEAYYRLQDEQRAILTGQASVRSDAEEQAPAKDDGIDWAKVAREAQIMVDLNKESNKRWQESQGSEAEE